MESLNTLLTAIERDLRELIATVDQLRRTTVTRQDLARLAQETTWDVNMLRQHVASKENLHCLAGSLATRKDLNRALLAICARLAGLQPEQTAALVAQEQQSRGSPPVIDRRHERSATVVARGRVLEIEDVGAVMTSGPEAAGERTPRSQGGIVFGGERVFCTLPLAEVRS
jgi:hypothetical protein